MSGDWKKSIICQIYKKVTNYFVITEVALHFYVCCINNTLIIDTENVMRHLKVKRSHYRPGVTHRVGRCIALLFYDRGTKRGW
jgi:hypothetical protein